MELLPSDFFVFVAKDYLYLWSLRLNKPRRARLCQASFPNRLLHPSPKEDLLCEPQPLNPGCQSSSNPSLSPRAVPTNLLNINRDATQCALARFMCALDCCPFLIMTTGVAHGARLVSVGPVVGSPPLAQCWEPARERESNGVCMPVSHFSKHGEMQMDVGVITHGDLLPDKTRTDTLNYKR